MSGATVLLVDDDPQLVRVLGIALRSHGHRVVSAGTADSAVKSAHSAGPDLVLLDLGLADDDGTTVIATLRAWTDIPIIIMSGRSGAADKIDALDLGADDYVVKPFRTDELLARIRAHLRRTKVSDPVRIGNATIDLGTYRVAPPRTTACSATATAHDSGTPRNRPGVACRKGEGGPHGQGLCEPRDDRTGRPGPAAVGRPAAARGFSAGRRALRPQQSDRPHSKPLQWWTMLALGAALLLSGAGLDVGSAVVAGLALLGWCLSYACGGRARRASHSAGHSDSKSGTPRYGPGSAASRSSGRRGPLASRGRLFVDSASRG